MIETNMSSSFSSMASSSPSRTGKPGETGGSTFPKDKPDPSKTVAIVTSDFPQYFAVISRSKQEVLQVGANGATLAPAMMPRVKVHIPAK